MKKHYYILFVATFLAFILSSCHKGKELTATAGGGPMSIEAFLASPAELENTIRTPGSILPNEAVDLKTEIPGRVVSLSFREGTHVARGIVLVQIDDSELRAELRKFQAQLLLAEEDEKRKKELLEVKGVSQEVYDGSLSALETLKADVDLTNSQIRKSKIVAPFDGTIGLRYISEGAYISSGDKIATLVQTNPVRIEFSVPEKYASMIQVSMNVQFSVTGSDKTYQAEIFAFEPMIDQMSRTLKVRARASNSDGKLIPGSYADLTIDLQKIPDAILVPTQVIVPSLNRQNVFIIKNGHAVYTEVTTGIQTDRMIQIVAGVAAGDTLVMTGILALKDNMPVVVSRIHTTESEQ
jgi:membrane fusion protein, multidrug efflux system